MNDQELNSLLTRARGIVAQQRDRYVTMLQEILRFETVSGAETSEGQARFREETDKTLDWLARRTADLKMVWRDYDRMAAVAEWTGTDAKRPAVGVAAHIDVVPVDDGWDHPPFSGAEADGCIWGRGTQDDKGPLVTVMAAIDVLQAAGFQPAASIRLLIGTQEETGEWDDVNRLIEAGEAPGPVFTPDGEFPIINGEKGMITFEIVGNWNEDAPGADNTGPRFVSLESGRRANMVPDTAILVLAVRADRTDDTFERFDKIAEVMSRDIEELEIEIETDAEADGSDETRFIVTVRGKAAHGSLPHLGRNAALDALAFLRQTEAGAPAMQAWVDFLRDRAWPLDASNLDLACHHDHLKDTTLNLGILKMSPTNGAAQINIRFPIGLDIATCNERVAAQVAALDTEAVGLEASVRQLGQAYEPLFVSPEENGEFLGPLKQAYEAVTGRECGFTSIGGTTYAKAYPLAVAFGPVDTPTGEIEWAHQKNERLALDRFQENILIYALALALLAE